MKDIGFLIFPENKEDPTQYMKSHFPALTKWKFQFHFKIFNRKCWKLIFKLAHSHPYITRVSGTHGFIHYYMECVSGSNMILLVYIMCRWYSLVLKRHGKDMQEIPCRDGILDWMSCTLITMHVSIALALEYHKDYN